MGPPHDLSAPIRVGALCIAALSAIAVSLSLSTPIAVADPVGTVTEFTIPNANSAPVGITSGPDGNMWFTEIQGNRVGRITPNGAISDLSAVGIPANGGLEEIATGPGSNVWVPAFSANKILRIAPDGTATAFSPLSSNAGLVGIAAGADGNMWFTESSTAVNKIGRITPSGTVTEFSAGITANAILLGIAAGPDGNMWFTERDGNKVGRITPSGTVTEFSAGITAVAQPFDIAAGADGNLWFTERTIDKIGRITPSGTVTEFGTGITANSDPQGIAAGPDGNMWFVEKLSSKIGRITPSGTVTEFSLPSVGRQPINIEAGADGNMWVVENAGNRIARIVTGASAKSLVPPSVAGSAQQGTQQVCLGDRWANGAGGQQPSLALFGYRWQLDGAPIVGAAGQSYTPVAGDVGHQLSCTVAVDYGGLPILTGGASSASVTVIPQASGPQGPQGATGPRGPAGRNAKVTCKPTKSRRGAVKITCKVRFTAGSSSRRLVGRIMKGGRVYAAGSRHVRAGRAGTIDLRACRQMPSGNYTLVFTFLDGRGAVVEVRQRITVT